jgi:ferrous iron transport protein B
MMFYQSEKKAAVAAFFQSIENTAHGGLLTVDDLMPLIAYRQNYRHAQKTAQDKSARDRFNATFKAQNPVYFSVIRPDTNESARTVAQAFRKLLKTRKGILRAMRKERIETSFLGKAGRWMEPVTRLAGFNWRVNVALLSALAAKESSVATLGALYGPGGEGQTLEQRMVGSESGFAPLHALTLMLFMVLYPPCLATSIAVKLQAGTVKWMLFSMAYPMMLGITVATLVFSTGSALGLTGLQAMAGFYAVALAFTIFTGWLKNTPTGIHRIKP